MKRRIALISMLIFLSSLYPQDFLRADVGKIDEYLLKNVVTKKLRNGITLIMLNRGYAPTLAFEMYFRVGSVDESYKTTGAAHLLEHMLFKGTDKIGTKNFKKEKPLLDRIEETGEAIDRMSLEDPKNPDIPKLKKKLNDLQAEHSKYVDRSTYDRIYTEEGGVGFNAGTSCDATSYHIELPASKLELWSRLESERLRNPVMREFYLERNNVIEERLMRIDSSGVGGLFERFFAAAFMAHPYRHPIIGWGSIIPHLSLRNVEGFYRSYYIPSRMTIAIVGKQDTDRTYQVIEKHFGSLKTRPEPPEVATKEPPLEGERRFTYFFEANPYIIIGWHKPTFPHDDDYVFEVAQEVLSGGKSSRLYRSLVLEKKIASTVRAWSGSPGARYSNLFIVMATPQPPHTVEDLEKAVYTELGRMRDGLSEDEVQNAKNRIESQLVFSMSTNMEIAGTLGYFQTVFRDWKNLIAYMDRIGKVSAADVKRVCDRYLTEKNRVVGILSDKREGKAQ